MKRILVTGGSRGLGLAVCKQLLAEGCFVVTTSRRSSADLDQLLRANSNRMECHAIDLSQLPAIETLVQKAKLLEGVDGWVANAAVGLDGLLTLNKTEDIDQCIRVNLLSTILLTREVVKGMLERGGSMVFVSSVAAKAGVSGLSVYSATKGALLAFSRSLAREYGERGIRSNCVLPGYFESEMNAGMDSESRERIRRRTALRRHIDMQDVAQVISFLISDTSRHITGTEFVVDAGMTA
jgi:3-oxoacyl-[acyl-carrier protein] reductase